MALRIFWNKARGAATSAIRKVIDRPCRTILAPLFTNLSRSVVMDHCFPSSGSTGVRRKLARL